MAAIEFVWDSRDLENWRDKRVERAIVRAVSKAGGDGLRAMRTFGAKMVRARKRFKVAKVKRGLPIRFPVDKNDITRLAWRMDVNGQPMPLVDFPHRQTKRGVSIAVNVGKRVLVKSAFIAKMKSGHEGIFLRAFSGMHGPLTKKQMKRGDRFRVGRLPIEEAYTTTIADVFEDQHGEAAVRVLQHGRDRMAATFARLLPIELEKVKAR